MKLRRPMVLVVLFLSACELAPPLRIASSDEGLRVGVETLGEYPTSIGRIRISELESEIVVLELFSEQAPQIWKFDLKPGENSVDSMGFPDPDIELYEVVVPAGGSEFDIDVGMAYLVEVRGKSGKSSRATFRF